MKTLILSVFFTIFGFYVQSQELELREMDNWILKGVPDEIPEGIKQQFKEYREISGNSFRSWMPDGKGMLISSESQIYHLGEPEGAVRKLTSFDNPAIGGNFNPDDNRHGFLFSMDEDGREHFQYYYYNLEDSTQRLLTDGKSINDAGRWDRSGDYFVYSSNRRNQRDFDIYKAPLKDPEEAEMILEGEGNWRNGPFSFDNEKMLVYHYISESESYYYILDMETLEKRQVNPVDEKIAYGWAEFKGDDEGLFVISDEASNYKNLHYYDIEESKMTNLTEDIDWNVSRMQVNEDGSKLAFTVNYHGISELYLMDSETFEYNKMDKIPHGIVTDFQFSSDDEKLALRLNSDRHPGEIFAINLEDQSLNRWTQAQAGKVNPEDLIVPEIIQYPTFDKIDNDSRKIPSFYYEPPEDGPHPVLIHIHGGPAAQFRPQFNHFIQFLVREMGIAVLAPNVRGSTGYGKTFEQMDNKMKREDAVRDIGHLLRWVEDNESLDEKKVALRGGSYGGYMVYASQIHYGEKIEAGISSFGIADLLSYLKNTQEFRKELLREEYGDERDSEMQAFLKEISPITNAEQIETPTFIIHGANDPRVPKSQAERMLEVIYENDIDVWYLMAQDEGHGFNRSANLHFANQAVILFLREYLLKN